MVDPFIIGAIVVGALSAASYYQQRKMQRQAEKQANEMASHQISGHDSNRALYTVYGRALIGTTTIYKRVSRRNIPMANANFTNFVGGGGSPSTESKTYGLNRFLYRISSLSNGPINGIESVLIDGEKYTANRFTAGHTKHFEAAVSLGPTAGNHFANLRTSYATDFSAWGADKKGQGVAYVVERFWFDKSNPAYQGEPSTQYLVKGRSLYDPRLDSTVTGGSGSHRSDTPSTWAFSDNPALALLDMLTNDEYGRGVSHADCNMATFITAANKCDTLVDIPARATNTTGATMVVYDPHTGTTHEIPDNGTISNYRIDQVTTGPNANKQKRFRLNMAVDNSKEVLDNIQQILQSFRGNLHHINGEYVVHMDDVASPVLTLTDDDIIGGLKIAQGDRKQRINRMTVKFLNANKHYKTDQVSWPPIDSNSSSQYQTYLTADSGEKLHKTVTLTGCTDYYQAEDIAEYLVRESRVTLAVSGTFGSRCFNLVPGDVIALDYDSAGYSGKYFIVDQVGVDVSSMNVKLSLREYDSSVYTWNTARGNEPVALYFDEEQQYNATPTSLTLGTVSSAVVTLADGTATVSLVIPYSGVPEEATAVEIGWAPSNTTDYTTNVMQGDETKTKFQLGIDNQNIDIRARYVVTNADGLQMPSGYATTTFTLPAVSGTRLGGMDDNATRNTGVLADRDTVDTIHIEADAVTAAKIDVTDIAAINADLGAITSGSLRSGNVTNPIPTDIFTRSSNQNIPTGTENGAFVDLDNGRFVFGDANSFISFADNSAGTARELDIKGVLAPTELDLSGVSALTVMPNTIKASGYADASIGKAALSEEAYNEIAARVGNVGGFYETASGFYLGSTKYITLSSTPTHGTQNVTVRVAISDVFTAPVPFSVNSNGVKVVAKLFYKLASDTNWNNQVQAGATQTFAASPTVLQYATRYTINASYEVTLTSGSGQTIADNTNYDFRVELTRLASPNAFQAFGSGGANDSTGTPVTLEVSEGTQVVAGSGNADTLDNLDSTQFLRSDADDTMTGDLTLVGALKMGDTRRIELGDDTDLKISHSGGGGTVENDTGNLTIKNRAVDGDIYFQSDDGTGTGTDTYFYLDGGEKKVKFNEEVVISDDLTVTGNLTITGNIDQYNVTDLDVTDKTITVNSGSTQALSDGAGLIVDRGTAADASITWDETNDRFEFSHQLLAEDIRLGRWSANGGYLGLFHANHTGNEYIIISADTHTYISATTGNSVRIRGGNNISSYEVRVYPDQDATASGNKIWHAGDFTSTNITNWNTAYGWGDHSTQGYLTAEADTLATVTGRGATTTNAISTGAITTSATVKFSSNNHYFQAGTNSVDLKNASNVVLGGFNASGINTPYNYQIGGTTVINSGRNLVNIGSIASGNISVTSASAMPITITGTNATYTALGIKNTGTGDAGIYADASNGDFAGSDYIFMGQKNNLDLDIEVGANGGNINLKAGGHARQVIDKDGYTLFPTLDLAISNANSSHGHNTYFRGGSSHFVIGMTSGNTFYLNYGNTAGTLYVQGNVFQWNGTTILDSSRNLSNIGTLTAAGTITSNNRLTVSRSTSSTTEPTATFSSGAGGQPYAFINTHDPYHGIIMRGLPAAATTYGVNPGNQMSFVEYGGDFRFYTKTPTALTQDAQILAGVFDGDGIKVNGSSVIGSNRRLTVADGTTVKAAYGFSSDSTTGISKTASGRIAFLSSGAVKAYIQTGSSNPISPVMYVDGRTEINGVVTWTGGSSTNANTAYTYSQVGHLPLAGGTMTGAINMGSNNLSGIGNATAVSFLSTNGYWVGGTQRMNGSGDLLNIGTISSGAITSSGQLSLSGNNLAVFGPNTGWSASLAIGGNANNSTSTRASIGVTSGNLHIDAAAGSFATAINFYDGTGGVYFGNGASGSAAHFNSSGHLNLAGTGVSASGYALSVGSTGVLTTGRALHNITFVQSTGDVTVGESGGTAYGTLSAGNLFFSDDSLGDKLAYSIGLKRLDNIGGNYTKLNIDWHTGITLGAATGYGGVRFLNNSVGYYNSTTTLFSVGEGDNHTRFYYELKQGSTTVIASTRRFYASDGTSVKAAYSFDGDSGTGISHTATGRIDFLSSGAIKAYIKTGTSNPISPTMYVDGRTEINGVVTWTGGSSTNANTAYGWGDHSTAGYMTGGTNFANDRLITASGANSLNGEANLTFNGTSLSMAGQLLSTYIGGNGSGGSSQYGIHTESTAAGQATLGAHNTGDSYANLNLSSIYNSDRKMWHISKRPHSINHQLELFWYESGGFNSRYIFSTGGNFTAHNNITANGSFITSTASSAQGIYAGSTQVFEGSTRNLKNIGTISIGSTTVINSSRNVIINQKIDNSLGNLLDHDGYNNYIKGGNGGSNTLYIEASGVYTNNSIIVGNNASKQVITRHIDGKYGNSNSYENLYLNYYAGNAVIVGRSDLNSTLQVHGPIQVGTTTVIDSSRNLQNINNAYLYSLIGVADTNTYINFAGNDETRFFQGGQERARFNGSGLLLTTGSKIYRGERTLYNGSAAANTVQYIKLYDRGSTSAGNVDLRFRLRGANHSEYSLDVKIHIPTYSGFYSIYGTSDAGQGIQVEITCGGLASQANVFKEIIEVANLGSTSDNTEIWLKTQVPDATTAIYIAEHVDSQDTLIPTGNGSGWTTTAPSNQQRVFPIQVGTTINHAHIDRTSKITLGGDNTNTTNILSSVSNPSSSGGVGSGNKLRLQFMEPSYPNYGAQHIDFGVRGGGYAEMRPSGGGLFMYSPYNDNDQIHIGYSGIQLFNSHGGYTQTNDLVMRSVNGFAFQQNNGNNWFRISPSGTLERGSSNTAVLTQAGVLQNVTLGHSNTGARFETNDWMHDTGGKARFYFEGGGRTFFGSHNGYVYRDSSDVGRATISNYGGVNLLSGGDGQVGSTVALAVGGTTVIDSSRNITTTGNIARTGTEGREIQTYMASSYTTNDIVAGHEYGWYNDYWRIGMSRSGNTAGEAFRFNYSGSYVAQIGTTGIFDGTGYRVSGTTVIDSSRNLTNIGTISSGGITALTANGSTTLPNVVLTVQANTTSTITTGGGTAIKFKGVSSGGNIQNYDQAMIASVGQSTNNSHGLDFYYKPNGSTALTKALSIIPDGTTVARINLISHGYMSATGLVNGASYQVGNTEIVSSQRRFYASTGTSVKAAFSFDGDSTTGMYRPAASQVAFITGATDALYMSNARHVVVGGNFGNNPYNAVDTTRLMFGGGNSDAQGNYYIGTNKENYGGNFTKLDLRWHTGIRMGAQPSYGGIRFFDTEDLGTVRFSIGKGDAHTRVESGNFYVESGSSYINTGSLYMGSTQVIDASRNLTNITSIATGTYKDNTDTFLFRSGATSGTTRHLNLHNGTGDPSGVDDTQATGITWGQRTDSVPYYMIYVDKENYNGNYSKLRINWHTGIQIGASLNYGGTRFYNDARTGTSGGSLIFSIGEGDNRTRSYGGLNIDLQGNNTAGGQLRLGVNTHNAFKWHSITGRQYDTSTETEGYSLVTGAVTVDSNQVVIGGGLDEQNAATHVYIKAASNVSTRNGTIVAQVTTDGFDIRNNVLKITGTTVIDASRVLQNISNTFITGNLYINNASPTVYLRDTDHRSCMLHCNTNYFYVLRGSGTDSTSWSQYNGYWPVYWNLEDNSAVFGGTITAASNITAYSDIRKKKDIRKLDNATDYLRALEAKRYKWKVDDREDIGFIAQDVEAAGLDVFVTESERADPSTGKQLETVKALDYGRMVSVLWQAVKEQQDQIDLLKQTIEEMKNGDN